VGGFGSGRIADPGQRKIRVEDCIVFNIDSLVRNGLLERGRAHRRFIGHFTSLEAPPPFYYDLEVDDAVFPKGPPYTGKILRIIRSRPQGGSLVMDGMQFVDLQVSKVHRGGLRHWFTCPGHRTGGDSTCSRRVGTLYLPTGKKEFRCRTCWNLAYKSQQTRSGRGTLLGSSSSASINTKPPWETGKSSSPFATVEISEETPEPPRRHLRSPEDAVAVVGTLAWVQSELRRMGLDEGHELWGQTTAFVADLVRRTLK